jgi:hypothetical protein
MLNGKSAAMESFFSTLKTEQLSQRIYRSKDEDECRAEVFDYISREMRGKLSFGRANGV